MKKNNPKIEIIINAIKVALVNDQITLIERSILQNKEIVNYSDKNGRTFLFEAILKNKLDVVKSLIGLGFDVNWKDNDGRTPLHFAVIEQKIAIVGFLLDNGANVNSSDNNGNSVLIESVFYSKGAGEIIEMLKGKGADPNFKNIYGIDAISLAKSIGNYNLIDYLR